MVNVLKSCGELLDIAKMTCKEYGNALPFDGRRLAITCSFALRSHRFVQAPKSRPPFAFCTSPHLEGILTDGTDVCTVPVRKYGVLRTERSCGAEAAHTATSLHSHLFLCFAALHQHVRSHPWPGCTSPSVTTKRTAALRIESPLFLFPSSPYS